jgi:hypothetical protein
VLLETTATGLDTPARTLATDAGTFHYNTLLIATGAAPSRLQVPGADLEGIYALRTLRDSQAIRAAAGSTERAVVVGGGFIGMEVAASLRQLGLAVTLIHLGRGLFDQFRSPALSAELATLYADLERVWKAKATNGGGQARRPRRETGSPKRFRRLTASDGEGSGVHGKEGVSGSSPEEGLVKRPANRHMRPNTGPGRASLYAPGARYWTCLALRRASIVSSTVRRTVVSNELSAPPPLIASATAAMDTLSGASHRL